VLYLRLQQHGEIEMNKVWHPYWQWEDVGMYSKLEKQAEQEVLQKATALMADHVRWGEYMNLVLDQFPIACEHNLTDTSSNLQAWIGQASCYLAVGCPEYMTKQIWATLSEEQQALANAEADKVIFKWIGEYEAKNQKLHSQMGIAGLS